MEFLNGVFERTAKVCISLFIYIFYEMITNKEKEEEDEEAAKAAVAITLAIVILIVLFFSTARR